MQKTTEKPARKSHAAANRPNLGASIKRLRGQRNVSLSALAAASGLPQSTLSKVENGQMSLNYDKLVRLAEVLEVDVRQLFMTEAEAAIESGAMARQTIDRADEAFRTADHIRYRYLSTALKNRLMLPALFEVGPSSRPDDALELMDIVGQRFAYVIQGPVDFLSAQYETVTLQTGDSIYIDSAMPHTFVARGGRTARIVTVLASSNPEYLEIAREATRAGEVDASNLFRERRKARISTEDSN